MTEGRPVPGKLGACAGLSAASRPKPGKLLSNMVLRQRVEQDLAKRYSPQQIVGRPRLESAHDPGMTGRGIRTESERLWGALAVPAPSWGRRRGVSRG